MNPPNPWPTTPATIRAASDSRRRESLVTEHPTVFPPSTLSRLRLALCAAGEALIALAALVAAFALAYLAGP